MRLTQKEQQAIKEIFLDIFAGGDICLFGSRVDDAKRGGDIDLYIMPQERLPISTLLDKKIDFLVKLKEKIGDQKIDILISRDQNRPIEQEALKNGVRL